MSFYKRNLPHWQPSGAEYFVTFRLAGSLPAEAVAKIRNERDQKLTEVRRECVRSSGSLPGQQGVDYLARAGSDRLSDLQEQSLKAASQKGECNSL